MRMMHSRLSSSQSNQSMACRIFHALFTLYSTTQALQSISVRSLSTEWTGLFGGSFQAQTVRTSRLQLSSKKEGSKLSEEGACTGHFYDDYDAWMADFDPSFGGRTVGNDDILTRASTVEDSTRWPRKQPRATTERRRTRRNPSSSSEYTIQTTKKKTRHHGYTQEPSDHAASDVPIDEPRIDELLQERFEARVIRRNYDLADEIREELLRVHGVLISDRDRQWRVRRNGRGDGRRKAPPPDVFGPNGHDYKHHPQAGPNTSELDDDEVHRLLSTRLQCKLKGDFVRADELQQELQQAGVEVYDSIKLWRADRGQPKSSPKARQAQGSSLPQDQVEQIESLVSQRADARRERNFDVADQLLEQLQKEHRVCVDDKQGIWFVMKGLCETRTTSDGSSEHKGDLSSLRVVDLKEMCRQAGLPVSGRKAELIERLLLP